ncbi:amidohydrolase family protein [Erythrobacter mangrovi]|uniref:Amidohydrolase family protein n=1 Tax=Erythrobacter mangrovi TaxID=2739433 RepID=A0A7D3Y1M9_9SPHN|nr:amidohydrolase family protein [Erythrobacter mangrovi]QKG72552.1 amidohydrolase family protein [Erythrobacter mangrovi]
MRVLYRRSLIGLGVLALLLVGLWLFVFRIPTAPAPSHEAFALDEVTIINPMLDRTPQARIEVAAGRLGLGTSTANMPVLAEYRGKFVLPGFVDMHTHLPGDNLLKLTQHYGLLHLSHGVTTIRSAGDIDGTADPAARQLISEGSPFPNMVSCGPFVSKGKKVWPNTLLVETAADAERAVAAIAEGGNSCVKAYEGLTPSLIRALIAAADARDMHVIGHVPVEMTLEKAGIPDVQHFFGVPDPSTLGGHEVTYRNGDWAKVDASRLAAVEAHILAKQIRNTPTIATLEGFQGIANPAVASKASKALLPSFFADVVWNSQTGLPVYRGLEAGRFAQAANALVLKQRLVKRLSDKGATLHIGTDAGQPFTAPGWSFWREMRLFEQAGITPEQVLAYATNVAGASLGNEAGRIAQGSQADLLIFAQDPTKSLDALDSLEAVVVRGKLYTRAELEQALRRSLRHYEAWPLRAIARKAAQKTVDEAARNF